MRLGKRLLSFLLCFLMLCSGTSVAAFAATEDVYGSFTYSVSSNEVTIVSYPENAKGSVSIPSEINGKPVVAIGDNAFQACTLISAVTIPNTVTSIGKYAFSYCVSLTNIVIPSSVTAIGKNAFQNTNNVVITCEKDSYAEQYAKENGIEINIVVIVNNDNIYNLGEETYSFQNYGDIDSDGHCFGMSMTSSGYYNRIIDVSQTGVRSSKDLYTLKFTSEVTGPICHYQGIQGSYAKSAIVAGGSYYINDYYDIKSDWNKVIDYVKGHDFDNKGILQIGFRKNNEGGHAINFLRYEVVSGQPRIYAYDNNFPDVETYFYQDSKGNIRQSPKSTFSGAIDCIALRNVSTYFNSAGGFDASRVIYADKGVISVEGSEEYPMEVGADKGECVVFEIPLNVSQVRIVPLVDNAEFNYLNEEYGFGEITDETVGIFTLATSDDGTASDKANLEIVNESENVNCVSVDNIEMNYKDTKQLNPIISVDEGVNYTVTYTSSNPSVATVDENGNVYGAKKGSADITVTVTDEYGNSASDTCTVQVKYSLWQWIIKILLFGWIWY